MTIARSFVAAAALLLLGLPWWTGCSLDLFQDECRTDADCGLGYSCGGLLARSCEPTCEVARCDRGTVCVDEMFGGYSCEPGCKTNDDCPAHAFCSGSCAILCGWDAPPAQCEPGCRDDSECSTSQLCKNGSCLERCREDSNCATGSFCAPDPLSMWTRDAGVTCLSGEQCSCLACSDVQLSVPPGSVCAASGGSDAAVEGG